VCGNILTDIGLQSRGREVTGIWTELYNEEFYYFYFSSNVATFEQTLVYRAERGKLQNLDRIV
jgi:hypothetical protein